MLIGMYYVTKLCGTYVAFQSGLARRQPLELVDASKAEKMVALFHVVLCLWRKNNTRITCSMYYTTVFETISEHGNSLKD